MKLLRIDASKEIELEKKNKKHWWSTQYKRLTKPYHAEFITDEGIYILDLKVGWVSDERSGSNAINSIVPKRGNKKYNASVAAHDTAYSGWISKDLADELFIRQGFNVSCQCSNLISNLAYKAVKFFGKSYYMDESMPEPYTENRKYESLYLVPRCS